MAIIEVFADVCCPFTHVGLRRLVERRALTGRDDLVLRVRAWPLELVNGNPLDPAFIGEEVDEIREQVAPDLFAGFDQRSFPPSSIPAMTLAARAYEVSDQVGEQISLALRDALFERGLDIGDAGVLAAIAEDHGLTHVAEVDDTAVRRSWESGKQLGVLGSPHFFVVDQGFFCPALHIERVDGHLQITSNEAEFERFLERALSA